jgi:Tfp pilus assembly protein PilN
VTEIYFAAAIGATLSGINLLPANIKNRELESAKKRLPYLLVVFFIVLLGALYFMKYSQNQQLIQEKENIQYQIDSMQDITEIKAQHAKMTEKKAFRLQLNAVSETRSDYVIDLIEGLEKTMPSDSFVTSLTNSDQILTLEYTVRDEATLAQVLTYLKSIEGGMIDGQAYPLFSSVYTAGVLRTGNPGDSLSYVTASIVCTYFETEVTE